MKEKPYKRNNFYFEGKIIEIHIGCIRYGAQQIRLTLKTKDKKIQEINDWKGISKEFELGDKIRARCHRKGNRNNDSVYFNVEDMWVI